MLIALVGQEVLPMGDCNCQGRRRFLVFREPRGLSHMEAAEMKTSEQISELAAALAAAQGMMENAIMNRVNPHFKSKYADLAAIFDAARKPLSANGLAIVQTIGDGVLHTRLLHTSGQWIASEHPLPMAGRPQEIGSALTYARRYSLSALIGIAADEDDDANAAQKKNGSYGELISGQQIVELSTLLDDDPKRIEPFCKLQMIDTLADMPAHRFNEAVKYIKEVNAKRKGREDAATE